MGKSPKEMVEAVIKNMPQKTGKTLQEWVKILCSGCLAERKEQIAWLKQEHRLGHVTAGIVADAARADGLVRSYQNDGALVDAMYSGAREQLRPTYEEVVTAVRKLGRDVKVSPCKTYVSLVRNRQFACIKPTTRTRIDLGLVLPGMEPSGRLQAVSGSPGWSERITLRVAVALPEDIDAELRRWLQMAYEQGGR